MINKWLEDGIISFLEEKLNDLLYKVPPAEEREVSINPPPVEIKKNFNFIRGYYSQEKHAHDMFPGIAIKTTKMSDTLETRLIDIEMIVGIYDKETESGYDSIMGVSQKIIDEITKNPVQGTYFYYAGDGEFKVAEPLYPYWYSVITMTFRSPKSEASIYGEIPPQP